MDDSLEANFAQRSQHDRNMSVRFASGDLELLSLTQIHVALQQLAKSFNSSGLPLRDVGDGPLFGLTAFAVAFANENRWGRVTVRHLDDVHAPTIQDLISIINHSVIITCVLITLRTATSALNVRVYMRLAGGSSD